MCASYFDFSQFIIAYERNKHIWNVYPTLFDVPNLPQLVTLVRLAQESRKRLIRMPKMDKPDKRSELQNLLWKWKWIEDCASLTTMPFWTDRTDFEAKEEILAN